MSNHDLLLVIDLQNVYTEGQPWACCHIRQAARNIRRLLEPASAARSCSPALCRPRSRKGCGGSTTA